MIEEKIIEYLNKNLCVPAYMEVPENPPDEYVVVEKTGGGESNHIESAVFAVQSYSDTLYKAAVLNEKVKKTMKKLSEDNIVSAAELNSDYNFTDTATKQYRYQAVFDIYY